METAEFTVDILMTSSSETPKLRIFDMVVVISFMAALILEAWRSVEIVSGTNLDGSQV